jgi:hypothetical protein
MNDRRGALIRAAAWRAATDRLTLIVAGVAATSSLVVGSMAFLVLALAGWALAIAVNLARRRVWREAAEALERKLPELPHEGGLTDPASRQFLSRLRSTRIERSHIIRDLSSATAPGATISVARAAELERVALVLIRALDRMNGHLVSTSAADPRSEMRRLQAQARTAGVPVAKGETEYMDVTLRSRLEATEQIAAWGAAMTVRLESMLAALEGIPARLVRADLCHASMRVLHNKAALTALREHLENLDAEARAAIEGESAPRAGMHVRF